MCSSGISRNRSNITWSNPGNYSFFITAALFSSNTIQIANRERKTRDPGPTPSAGRRGAGVGPASAKTEESSALYNSE